MNSKQAYELAMELPGVTVKNHFGSDGFTANKRMFLTIWHDKNQANLRLSPEQQAQFLSLDGDSFSEIDNAWGRQGWTSVNFQYVDKSDLLAALKSAWEFSNQKVAKAVSSKSKTTKKKKAKKKK